MRGALPASEPEPNDQVAAARQHSHFRRRRVLVTDEVGRLVELYIAEARAASVSRKLSLLMDVRRNRDPRAFAFLLQILADGDESSRVRTYVLKRIRNGELAPDYRERAAA